MNEISRFRLTPKVVAGGILILLGILFVLDNFGLIDAGYVFDYWPLILVAVGLGKALEPRQPSERVWGWILMGVGALLLLRTLDIMPIRFRDIWPLILVAIGARLVWQAFGRRSQAQAPNAVEGAPQGPQASLGTTGGGWARSASGSDRLDEFAMFGGGDRLVSSQSFAGGSVTVIMGGFDIDLRQAQLAGGEASIEVFVMMGGIDLKVPEGWNVILDVMPILGGTEHKARRDKLASEGPVPTLRISGAVILGGIEIKN